MTDKPFITFFRPLAPQQSLPTLGELMPKPRPLSRSAPMPQPQQAQALPPLPYAPDRIAALDQVAPGAPQDEIVPDPYEEALAEIDADDWPFQGDDILKDPSLLSRETFYNLDPPVPEIEPPLSGSALEDLYVEAIAARKGDPDVTIDPALVDALLPPSLDALSETQDTLQTYEGFTTALSHYHKPPLLQKQYKPLQSEEISVSLQPLGKTLSRPQRSTEV